MKIPFKDIFIKIKSIRLNNPHNDLILFIHGFSGSSRDWEVITSFVHHKFNLAAFDLIGHGESDSPSELSYYGADKIVEIIKTVIQYYQKDKVILCGYSMGGRAALSFAIQNSDLVKAMILESSTAGIINENERKLRTQNDNELVQYILTHSIIEFVDYWTNLELFNSQKKLDKEIIDRIRYSKQQNNPIGLVNSLRGFGTGVMPPLFNCLENLKIQTLLITGKLDLKFTHSNQKINKLLPLSHHVIVEGAGHNVHLENPSQFGKVLNSFLIQL